MITLKEFCLVLTFVSYLYCKSHVLFFFTRIIDPWIAVLKETLIKG